MVPLGDPGRALDAAVAAACGWAANLSDDEVLSRPLALNLERSAQQARAVPAAGKAAFNTEEVRGPRRTTEQE